MYVLEIMRFAHDGVEDKRRAGGVFEHVGYATEPNDRPYANGPTGAKRIREFRTKAAAAAAYDRLFVPTSRGVIKTNGDHSLVFHRLRRRQRAKTRKRKQSTRRLLIRLVIRILSRGDALGERGRSLKQ